MILRWKNTPEKSQKYDDYDTFHLSQHFDPYILFRPDGN